MGCALAAPGSRVLRQAVAAAVPVLSVDRLLGQPRTGERDRRPVAWRALRPPQRREPGRAYGLELSDRHAVRDGYPEGSPYHRLRPLRLQWRAGVAARRAPGLVRQL